jgi:hypothetical protein
MTKNYLLTLLRFALLYRSFYLTTYPLGFFEKQPKCMLTCQRKLHPILYMKRNGSISIESFWEPTAAKMIIESLKKRLLITKIGYVLITKQVGIGTKHL